jgi:L-ascorbate metabolism protein UlaG (beta-lactamase superfamily)
MPALVAMLLAMTSASAQQAETRPQPVSQCLAVAQNLPGAQYARIIPASFTQLAQTEAIAADQVRITYAAHSTYLIETAGGISIATDFNGYAGPVRVPTVVTMNKAHTTHFTAYPDPAIAHVLRGWGELGEPADHDLLVGDAYIRNVTTDIRSGGYVEVNANSIFIIEAAGLCIGHLGHLHHELTDKHYAQIGRLDIVMVPVDGGLTLSLGGMSAITKRLYSSIVLPMHRQGAVLQDFMAMMGTEFAVDFLDTPSFNVSMRSLPRRPTVMVPKGMW